MIKAFILCHPQSANLITEDAFKSKHVVAKRISCGTTKIEGVDFSESNDFFPTYASWNSALFETSVIMTIWEHADELIGDDHVAIMHSDITPHFRPSVIWSKLNKLLTDKPYKSIGLTAPSSQVGLWTKWLIPNHSMFSPKYDPMHLHAFDEGVFVWEFIKKYDPNIYDWAMSQQPRMVYSHQFACTRDTFSKLGQYLLSIASKLPLSDIGFWTPHMFERLIALYLAKIGGEPVLTTAFWHHASSGVYGPGAHSLYGPRPLKYYKCGKDIHD